MDWPDSSIMLATYNGESVYSVKILNSVKILKYLPTTTATWTGRTSLDHARYVQWRKRLLREDPQLREDSQVLAEGSRRYQSAICVKSVDTFSGFDLDQIYSMKDDVPIRNIYLEFFKERSDYVVIGTRPCESAGVSSADLLVEWHPDESDHDHTIWLRD